MDQILVDGLTVNPDKSRFEATVKGIQEYQRTVAQPHARLTPEAHKDFDYPTPLRMMSFDGAAYAPLALRMLDKVEDQYPGFLEKTSLFCGTSDGAFVALALSFHLQRGASAKEAIKRAIEFEDEVMACFAPTARDWMRFVTGQGPLYGQTFVELLKTTFGDHRLDSLEDRPVSLMAFNASDQRPFTFTCFGPQATDMSIVEAALAVSSLPFLMPVSRAPDLPDLGWYRPQAGDILVDGGMANNDPTINGISDVLLCLCQGQENYYWTARRFLPYLRVLSFGASPSPWSLEHVRSKLLEWGWPRLLWEVGPFKMVDLMLGGPSASNQGICKQLIGVHRYLRFESPLSLSKSVLKVMRNRADIPRLIAEYNQLADEAWNQALSDASAEPVDDAFPALPNWVERFWVHDWSREHAWYW